MNIYVNILCYEGFWLLKKISQFLDENRLSLNQIEDLSSKWKDNVPLIITGDFNSRPSSSINHLMNDKHFTPGKEYLNI